MEEKLGKVGEMRYTESLTFIFNTKKWPMNLLFGGLCILSMSVIPIVGQLIMQGYQFEILEKLHTKKDESYPDFDFHKLGQYLIRGVWIFLVTLVSGLVVLPFVIGGIAIIFFSGVTSLETANPTLGTAAGIALFVILSLFIALVGTLVSLAFIPLMLRAGLSQDFLESFNFGFVKQFIANVWLEILLSSLFLFAATALLIFLGMMMLCIGVYFTFAISMLMQAHIYFQLYELHLARGGDAIPLKIVESTSLEMKELE